MSNQSASTFLSKQNNSKMAAVNTPQTQSITRTLLVQIEGSLTDMAHRGPLAGLWKGANGREGHMFHPNLSEDLTAEQSNAMVNSLRNAVIKKLTVKEHQNTFPYALGIDINCVPPTEVTNIGEKFTYTVLPNSVISTPQLLYQCDSTTHDNSNWQQLYSQWNNSNLETHGVMDVPNQSFLFVHMDHPVIGLLRYNQNLIGCDIDATPKLEKEYFKVSKQVMATCCQTIRDDVLSKMACKDLNQFSLQARKLNNAAWDEMDHVSLLDLKLDLNASEEEQMRQKQVHVKDFLTKPYQYIARLEIEYEIPLNK